MEICEMRRTSWILVTLLCLPSILSSTGFQHGHAEDPLDKRIDSLQLQNETILDALARMNAATELSVSFEAILKESLSSQDVGYPRFTTRIEGGSVREILDRICVLDGRFTWSRYKNTINVYPRSSMNDGDKYFVNRRLSVVQFKELTDPAQGLFQAVALLPGPLEQIAYSQTGGAAGFSRPWSVVLNDVTVRQAFDEIAEHLGKGYGWTLSGAKQFRVLRFHARLLPALKRPPGDNNKVVLPLVLLSTPAICVM